MAQIFPESVKKFWSNWEIRLLVLGSLILQSVLILVGNKRKYSTGLCIRFVLWFAYLSADWIATLSLGVLSSNSGDLNEDDPKFLITSFWAPFLLLHLGGPDNITAYSLEDNELWWRHCVKLVVQLVVAFYVFLRAWTTGNELKLLAIPIFFAGMIKLGERTWVRCCASSKYFRKRMFRRPDPGPNYARYMEDYRSKQLEGYQVRLGSIVTKKASNTVVDLKSHDTYNTNTANPEDGDIKNVVRVEDKYLQEAYAFFKTFKRLFADLILSTHDIENSHSFFQGFQDQNYNVPFQVIEIELGFIYDVFYTKANFVYSLWGGFLRVISFLFIVVSFVGFFTIEKQAFSRVDVAITYILLAGAVVLGISGIVLLLCSDWTRQWLISKDKSLVVNLLYRAISLFSPAKRKIRWSDKIAQYNLISFCLKNKPSKWDFFHRVPCVYEPTEKNQYKTFHRDLSQVKELIFQQLRQKSRITGNSGFGACKEQCANRGRWVLEREGFNTLIYWSIDEAEFDQSILLWHIATDLCYYNGIDIHTENSSNSDEDLQVPNNAKENSKLLSDYMLYLLVMRPFMMPDGIGQIRFQDTCAEATEFFQERELKRLDQTKEACKAVLEVCTDILPSEVKGDRSKSVLFDACRLAKDLRSLNKEKKWELVSHVWVEMLCYAASQCQRDQHAHQLRKGGELLTHVWLLMAHLGITQQFQITKGYARAKLIVE